MMSPKKILEGLVFLAFVGVVTNKVLAPIEEVATNKVLASIDVVTNKDFGNVSLYPVKFFLANLFNLPAK